MSCVSSYLNADFVAGGCGSYGNSSETRVLDFRIRDCSQDTNTCDDLFNNTLCGADTEYFRPLSETYLEIQVNFLDTINTYPIPTIGWLRVSGDPYFVKMEVTDCCTCEPLEESLSLAAIDKANVGIYYNTDGSFRYFQNIKINITSLPDIFGLKFTDNLGNTLFTRDCYKKVKCVGSTVIVETEQSTGTDCAKFVYAVNRKNSLFGDNYDWIHSTEVLGEAFIDSYNLSKVLVRQSVLSSETNQKIKLNTDIISQFHAEDIMYILSTNRIHIRSNNNEFDVRGLYFNGEMNKNQASSRMWQLSLELASLICQINYRCSI